MTQFHLIMIQVIQTDWLVFLSDLLQAGLRIVVCLLLISRLLSLELPNRKSFVKSLVTGAAGALVITVVISLAGFPELLRVALEAVWIAVCGKHLLRADMRMGLFVSIYYEIAVSFWTFLLMAGMGVLFRQTAFLDETTWNGQAVVWMLHILLFAGMLYLLKNQDIEKQGAFRFTLTASAAGLIAVVTLSEQTVLEISDDALSTWTILSVVLMMAVLVFNMNRQYESEKELAKLKSEQAELLERDYTTLNNAYAVNAKLFHDFHNHIGALRQLLTHAKYTEAVRYLDELQAPVREMTDTVWTGDETVDYLINSKTALAAAERIQLQVQVEFPKHAGIRSADLCAILGNLLDNALEAAGQVIEPEKRLVKLTIRRINQMLVIKVENYFADSPIQVNGELKTTKTEGGLHGWGLKSARTAALKYDGMVRTECSGELFRAVATLCFDGVQ